MAKQYKKTKENVFLEVGAKPLWAKLEVVQAIVNSSGGSPSLFLAFGTKNPPKIKNCGGLIRHRPPGPHPRIRLALPSSRVDLTSIQHRFDIEIGSNQEIDVESMSNRCQIDAKSTPEEGRAMRIRGWVWGPLGLINPSQIKKKKENKH